MGTRVSRLTGIAFIAVALALVVGLAAGPGLAGPGNNPLVKVAVHTKAHPTSCTKGYPAFTACTGISTTWNGAVDVDVMPVFYDLAEVLVVEFGMTWPVEWYSMSWVRCKGDLAIGTIKYSGEGTAVSWTTCQNSWALAPGYGWLAAGSPGRVNVVANPSTGMYGVVDCQPSPGPFYNTPISVARAGVNGLTGDDPCVSPVIPLTVTKIDDIGSSCVYVGGNIGYTLNYSNPNPSAVTGVTLVDSLPAEVDFVSATAGGSYDSGTHRVTWSLGGLVAGGNGSVGVTTQVKSTTAEGTTIVNHCRIACAENATPGTGQKSTSVCACLIDGADTSCPLTRTTFTGPASMKSWAWSVTGNGTVVGASSERTFVVRSGSLCDSTYTVNLTVVDQGDISSSCNKVVAVGDDVYPQITTCPRDTTVQCITQVPPVYTGGVVATDNCGSPAISHAGDVQTGSCAGADVITIVRTYRATDACGNYVECQQTITVDDTTPPEFTVFPADTTVQCYGDVPAHSTDGIVATDNCGTPSVAWVEDAAGGTECNGTVSRMYRATDGCGNVTDSVQTFTVHDTTQPEITGQPDDQNVQCLSAVPAPDISLITATDNCGVTPVVTFDTDQVSGTACNGEVTRIYRVTDGCGNITFVYQSFFILDTTNPYFTAACPENTTAECGAVPTAPTLTAADNCDAAVEVTFNQQTTPGACPPAYTLVRTWTATDDCGNTAQCVQTITVNDITAPVFDQACPTDATVECAAVPTAPTLTATDACDGSVTVNFDEQSTPGTCPTLYTLVRTWTATDNCGNSRQCRQTITVRDTTAPVFTSHPGDVTVACRSDIPAATPGACAATDNCGGPVTFAHVGDVSDGRTCPEVITRTYSATDGCGNRRDEVQLITVDDNVAPTLSCASDGRVPNGTTPVFTDPTVSDNCDDQLTPDVVSTNQSPGPGPGEVTHTRCWTATDACGNTSVQCCQRIIVEAPGALTPLTISKSIEGTGCVYPDNDIVYEIDYANPNEQDVHSVVLTDVIPVGTVFVSATGGGAYDSGTRTVTWSLGALGALASGAQGLTVHVQPTVAPGTALGNNCYIVSTETSQSSFALNVPVCACLISGPETSCPLGTAHFCGPEGMTSYAWSVMGDGEIVPPADARCIDVLADSVCGGSYTLELTVGEPAGGTSTCQKLVAVGDGAAPVFTSVLTTINVQCPAGVPAPDLGLLAATDNCGPITFGYVGDVSDGNSCPEVITRTYSAHDGCGNYAYATQYIRVHDTTPPVVTCPRDTTFECNALGDAGAATAEDNCSAGLVPGYVDNVVPGGGPGCYTIERTWSVEDDCDNPGQCVQLIHVVDTTPPTIECPGNGRIGCTDPLVWGTPTASDLCDADPMITVVSTDTVPMPSGAVEYTRTWEASDGCGNTARCSQLVTRAACPNVPFELTKVDDIAECVNPGGTIVYTLNYRNPNAGHATNAWLVDRLPDSLTVVDASGGIVGFDPPTVTWLLGTVPGGASGQQTITAVVDPAKSYGASLLNQAAINSDQVPTATTAMVTDVCEYAWMPLRLEKDDMLTGPAAPGDTIYYEIRVYNDNAQDLTNVLVVDALPTEVSLVWTTSPYVYDAGTHSVTWPVAVFPAGSSLLFNLHVEVNPDAGSGSIVNTVSATSDQTTTPGQATETSQIAGGEVRVYVDIKPGSCPNSFNTKAKGVLPVAVLGTSAVDVSMIDPASLRLGRANYPATVAPIRWSREDVAAPYEGDPCGCNERGRDGYRDLTLKFSTEELVRVLGLANAKGQDVELMLTGALRDGTAIAGADCIRVLGRADEGEGQVSMGSQGVGFDSGDQMGGRDGAQINLAFFTAGAERVRLDVYDVHGRLVRTLVDGTVDAGIHAVAWDVMSQNGLRVPAGIYFVRLSARAEIATKKLIVVE
ncbi:MAG: FlgD immunoglobulin-like domain containing protein [bacterium]